jgi:phenylpropionate dioxygenase-like ring-hydroxylating dioxygenase large terminal subunit
MYINLWYVAATSAELTDRPMKVTMLGQDFVVFRGADGKARCLSNVCVHRGGNLSGGKIHGDVMACPYHGWQFNGEGQCVKIPSLGKDAKIPPRTRIDAYPTEERYGLVYAFLGDADESERVPIMDIPEYGQEGWRANLVTNSYKGSYERGMENALDPAHNEFVHPTHGFSGARDDYSVRPYDMRETPHGGGFIALFNAPKLTSSATMNKLRNYDGDMEAGSFYVGPHQVLTTIHMTPTNWFHQYSYRTPVNEGLTKTYLINMRNALPSPEHDKVIVERQYFIQTQDIAILEAIEPLVPPHSTARESLMPADKAIVHYRKYLETLNAKGWRIDSARVAADKSRVAYAIPSPGRGQAKGWVIDPIPLLDGAAFRAQQAAE